jgi:hypothetical protein
VTIDGGILSLSENRRPSYGRRGRPASGRPSMSGPPDRIGSVSGATDGILVLEGRIATAELARLVERYFGDMVKYVVDVRQRILAIGGELHADAEQLLLERGSRQQELWGANYYPGRGPDDCIEFTALINIRPAQGNRSMELLDPALRASLREITFALIGQGEPLT